MASITPTAVSTSTTARGRSRSTREDPFSEKSEAIFFESLEKSHDFEVAEKATIRIRDDDEVWADLDRLGRMRSKTGKRKSTVDLGYPSLEHLRQFLTPQRQFLYRVLRRKNPGSIYELAKMLGRPYKAVAQDLKVLKEMHLVRFKTEIHDGRARSRPILTHKKLVIEFG